MVTRSTFPGKPPGRGAVRSWWGKAWQRSVEEAAFAAADLKLARQWWRAGALGVVTLEEGEATASVRLGDDVATAQVRLPVFSADDRDAWVEAVAAQAGRIGSLLAGDLPYDLVEHAEQAGVELLPFGGEYDASCTCEPWLDPCPHSLVLLLQLGRLVDVDPLVLLHLRGLPRADLLARLHDHRPAPPAESRTEADVERETALDLAVEAATRAERIIAAVDAGETPSSDLWP